VPIASYLAFVAREKRFLAFGFLLAFGSSFGQTYFIGIFGPSIQAEFDLSHTSWGTIYMTGTICSALLLPWTGRHLDLLDLRIYTVLACGLLIVACLVTAFTPSALVLVFAIFLLRQSGQGLMSHTAITSMARYYQRERGRAIAIATIGFASGEAVLPVLAVASIALLGWRTSYAGAAVLLGVVLLPAVLWLCKGHSERHQAHLELTRKPQHAAFGLGSWTVGEMLRDVRFYLLLPGVMAPGLILTAMFFHHLNLADAKGWSHAWITGSYVIYAVTTTVTSLFSGALVDRFGAARVVPIMLVPLTLALLVFWAFDSKWAAWPYLALAGINVGIAFTAVSAMWPEVYGVIHLGAIKSLTHALGVFASALGPVTMGALTDLGVPIADVCLIFAGYALFGTLLMKRALRPRRIFTGGGEQRDSP